MHWSTVGKLKTQKLTQIREPSPTASPPFPKCYPYLGIMMWSKSNKAQNLRLQCFLLDKAPTTTLMGLGMFPVKQEWCPRLIVTQTELFCILTTVLIINEMLKL